MKMKEEKHIYTVSEVTRGIKVILEDSFPAVWVEGEVSGFKHHSSGHFYFGLKDEHSQLRAVMFRGQNEKIKFKIEDGLKVICFGRIGVYEKRGEYQIYVEVMEPQGVGALQLAFEQLKRRLHQEGLFDPAHKKPLPMLPQRIGVVTSPTGAAIRDILNILTRRFPNVHIILNPVAVQGKGAAEEIALAINEFNRLANVEVIIVGRGGGSPEDLWAFNEEVVARAIYDSRIPIVSAVGHEIDTTISDFVADLRAPTPSAAAELVVPSKAEITERINNLRRRLKAELVNRVSLMQSQLNSLMEKRVFRQPFDITQQYQQTVDNLSQLLGMRAFHLTELRQERFKNYLGRLDALSPLKVILRGYSISMKLPEGKLIRDVSILKEKDLVETRVSKGKFVSEVRKIQVNESARGG